MARSAGITPRRTSIVGALTVMSALSLAGCSTVPHGIHVADNEGVERVVGPNDPVPPGGGRYQVGKPYSVGGQVYVPQENASLDETGMASWYGGEYHHGTRTANGEVVDRWGISAAHRTMPLPSYARVTSVATGRSIVVRVNDRGPYARGRIIDLSEKTAELLDIKGRGVSKVRVQYVGRAGLGGSDQKVLMASLTGPGLRTGADDRTVVASADLPVGPRRATPTAAPTMVATADTPIAPTAFAAPRPTMPTTARALAAPSDPMAFELAGVDAARFRAAMQPQAKPASTSAEVIEAEMGGASGAPMALAPLAVTPTAYDPGTTATTPARTSYAAETRISEAFAAFGEGRSFSRLSD